MNPVWSVCIGLCSVPFILCAMTPEAILYTQLSKEIGLYFFYKMLRFIVFWYACYYSFPLSDW